MALLPTRAYSAPHSSPGRTVPHTVAQGVQCPTQQHLRQNMYFHPCQQEILFSVCLFVCLCPRRFWRRFATVITRRTTFPYGRNFYRKCGPKSTCGNLSTAASSMQIQRVSDVFIKYLRSADFTAPVRCIISIFSNYCSYRPRSLCWTYYIRVCLWSLYQHSLHRYTVLCSCTRWQLHVLL